MTKPCLLLTEMLQSLPESQRAQFGVEHLAPARVREYLRRNLVVAKAYGLEAALLHLARRLRSRKTPTPKWLAAGLDSARDKLPAIISEAVAHRDERKKR